ncbi:methyl-accepting chemotaxis protein [Marinobacter sp. HN1S83]|uniref:methyl-accepting chemotaxis protein n=1 Tax=Marinobacter sp. HN1S83 TaxID=3382301 RepID=UPI00387AA977
MLSALKISHKLGLLVTVAILAFLISLTFSIITDRKNSSRLSEVKDRLYPTLELTTINLGQLRLMEQQINGSVATGDDQQLNETARFKTTISENLKKLSVLNQGLSRDVRQVSQLLDTYYSEATRIASAMIEGTADFSSIGREASENAKRLETLQDTFSRMQQETRARFEAEINHTLQASADAGTVAVGILVTALVVMIALSLVIGRSISTSLSRIIGSLRNMASGEGDLTSRIEYQGRDELRELVDHFNLFVEKLHTSFGTIRNDVAKLNTVSGQLGSTSSRNLELISHQSQSISSTRNSVDELVISVEEVAGFAASASEQTRDAANFATSGQEKVERNATSIRLLVSEIESTSELVNQFDEFSTKVGGLLETIQAVAEQTNLLALNAAIEAARAGEHGRGFAVVADEVRGLAVRTHKSTEEIQGVISELSKLSTAAVESMNNSVGRAHEGVQATTESGEILNQILTSVQQISGLNEQIAAATYEQSTTFNQITSYMTDMHRNAESVMESTDELDTVSEDIQKVSHGLQSVASQFRV